MKRLTLILALGLSSFLTVPAHAGWMCDLAELYPNSPALKHACSIEFLFFLGWE